MRFSDSFAETKSVTKSRFHCTALKFIKVLVVGYAFKLVQQLPVNFDNPYSLNGFLKERKKKTSVRQKPKISTPFLLFSVKKKSTKLL